MRQVITRPASGACGSWQLFQIAGINEAKCCSKTNQSEVLLGNWSKTDYPALTDTSRTTGSNSWRDWRNMSRVAPVASSAVRCCVTIFMLPDWPRRNSQNLQVNTQMTLSRASAKLCSMKRRDGAYKFMFFVT